MKAVKGSVNWFWQTACWIILIASLSVLVAAVMIPRLTAATPYTIMTGSMTESYPAGTLVIVKPQDHNGLEINDSITYQLESGKPEVVTHRIVGIGTSMLGETLFETKGDSNATTDKNLVKPVQIKGKVWYSIPYLGHASFLLEPDKRWQINYALGAMLAFYAMYNFVAAYRNRKRKDKDSKLKVAPKINLKRLRLSQHLRLNKISRAIPTKFIFVVGVVALASTLVFIPSGAHWNAQALVSGTQVIAGQVVSTVNPYCKVINTNTNAVETGANCTITLANNGCSNFWNTAGNVYIRYNFTGVNLRASNSYGNALRVDFALDLQALGCNPPAINWSSHNAGIQTGSSITLASDYNCDKLPIVEGRISYYSSFLSSVHLGTLRYDRTSGAVTC